jgi:hypothetical protein
MRNTLLFVLLLALVVGCASSPLATSPSDRKALFGEWEEDWPGQTEKDLYRIGFAGEEITITPLSKATEQSTKHVVFQQKRLTFDLMLDGAPVHYDLVLITPTQLSGRATGGKRNFDEPVRWYKK